VGVLDDLKREADVARANPRRRRAAAPAAAGRVQSRVQALYAYFRDLQAQLQALSLDVEHDFEVRAFGALERLRQGNYRIHTEDPAEHVERFTFHYECASEGKREVRLAHRSEVSDLREFLWANNLRYSTRAGDDGATVVALENVVPVAFEFQADYEREGLRLRVRNLEELGTTVHVFDLEQVDEVFMDEIAKRILGRPNRYDDIFGNKLTDTSRLRLREMIAERKAAREREEMARRSSTTGPREESLTARFSRTLLGRR